MPIHKLRDTQAKPFKVLCRDKIWYVHSIEVDYDTIEYFVMNNIDYDISDHHFWTSQNNCELIPE